MPEFLINLAKEEKERKGRDTKRNNSKFHLQSVSSPKQLVNNMNTPVTALQRSTSHVIDTTIPIIYKLHQLQHIISCCCCCYYYYCYCYMSCATAHDLFCSFRPQSKHSYFWYSRGEIVGVAVLIHSSSCTFARGRYPLRVKGEECLQTWRQKVPTLYKLEECWRIVSLLSCTAIFYFLRTGEDPNGHL